MDFIVVFNAIFVFFAAFYSTHLATIHEDEVRPDPVMLCYYGSWATYRPGIGKFDAENTDTSLCTHIIYAFMGLRNGVITSLDEYNDYEESWGKGSLKRFSSHAKLNGIKALIAIGGWNEGSVNYSRMASSDEGRNVFADSAVEFIKKFNFDGLDLDWEYPTQRGGIPDDKENYSLLLQTLSEKLHAAGLMLTVAVTANPTTAEIGYDFQRVAEYADYVTILSFDYHTAGSDNFTGLIAPLYQLPGEDGTILNLDYSINTWLEGGVPAKKLVVGIPLYGRTYTLQNASRHNIGDPIVANGTAGQYTGEPGFLAYYEICLDHNWEVVRKEGEYYLYAYKNDQWMSFDDASTIRVKAQLVMGKGLAGMMAWALDYEDFYNVCGFGVNPLLTAANEVLGRLRYRK